MCQATAKKTSASRKTKHTAKKKAARTSKASKPHACKKRK